MTGISPVNQKATAINNTVIHNIVRRGKYNALEWTRMFSDDMQKYRPAPPCKIIDMGLHYTDLFLGGGEGGSDVCVCVCVCE